MKRYYQERAATYAKLAKRRGVSVTDEDTWRTRAATYLAKANGYNGAKP